jgi:hypothetical protein
MNPTDLPGIAGVQPGMSRSAPASRARRWFVGLTMCAVLSLWAARLFGGPSTVGQTAIARIAGHVLRADMGHVVHRKGGQTGDEIVMAGRAPSVRAPTRLPAFVRRRP